MPSTVSVHGNALPWRFATRRTSVRRISLKAFLLSTTSRQCYPDLTRKVAYRLNPTAVS